MRRVLLISPEFPPNSNAGAHRVRLLAPHLPQYGWEPTVLTVEPEAYEGQLDPELLRMVPESLRVVRCRAISPKLTRRLGIGDLGLRSVVSIARAANRLLSDEHFDAVFITIFPVYVTLLGPWLARRFKIPFVIDYIDPWVGAWGATTGGGPAGAVDFKSRMSLGVGQLLEPWVVAGASAITAVSTGTIDPILKRNPAIRPITDAIPFGAEPRDFSAGNGAMAHGALPFDPSDGLVHICYTGTILPLGMETLGAVMQALGLMRDTRPELYRRLRLHFIGSSNQATPTNEMRAMPLAERFGVADAVHEVPTRVPYSTIVSVLRHASALLAMGSSESHYTASKIFPFLLAKRPLLAVYHEQSTVVQMLRQVARPPTVSVVTYSDTERAQTRVRAIADQLIALADAPPWRAEDVDLDQLTQYFAENLAGRLARVFDRAAESAA